MPVEHYENFPVASILIPAHLRRPVEVIYHFARSADDIADEGDAPAETRLAQLAHYDAQLQCIERDDTVEPGLFSDLAVVIAAHGLPVALFRDLLSAFAQDVTTLRYPDYAGLLDYCARSANPVGRLMLHLFGQVDEEACARSDAICTALQLTNFWQDVAIDTQKGRIYLPQNEMQQYRVSEADVLSGHWSANFAALLDFQIDRTRRLMLQGAPLARQMPGRFGWELRLTVLGGLRILDRLQRVRGDSFRRRPVLKMLDWSLMLAQSVFNYPK